MGTPFSISPALVSRLAPTGVLRPVINLGNPVLAYRSPRPEQMVAGVSIDIAYDLAHHLGVDVSLTVVDSVPDAIAAILEQKADLGFFSLNSCQGQAIAASHPYLFIEGCYLVRQGSAIQNNDDIDHARHRVVVGRGSAYDQFLSRELAHAQLVRARTSEEAISAMLDGEADVTVGMRQTSRDASTHKDNLRQIDGCFMILEQVLGIPAQAGAEAARFLIDYTEYLKASGFVRDSLAEHYVIGATVAPPAPPSTDDRTHPG